MTVSERPGASYQVEIHFVNFNHFLISFISFMKIVIIFSEENFKSTRNLEPKSITLIEKFRNFFIKKGISVWQLVPEIEPKKKQLLIYYSPF